MDLLSKLQTDPKIKITRQDICTVLPEGSKTFDFQIKIDFLFRFLLSVALL